MFAERATTWIDFIDHKLIIQLSWWFHKLDREIGTEVKTPMTRLVELQMAKASMEDMKLSVRVGGRIVLNYGSMAWVRKSAWLNLFIRYLIRSAGC